VLLKFFGVPAVAGDSEFVVPPALTASLLKNVRNIFVNFHKFGETGMKRDKEIFLKTTVRKKI
jgi:hypothetical protein